MSIVNDTQISGRMYERVFRVTCENPLSGNLSITFEKMRVVEIPGVAPVETYIGPIVEVFTEATAGQVFPLRDLTTGAVIDGATMTDAQLYAALYSRSIFAMEQETARAEQDAHSHAAELEGVASDPG